eukprot:2017026-Prymnesium_polylepis.2
MDLRNSRKLTPATSKPSSEIWILGTAGSSLRLPANTAPLLTVKSGAPTLHLRDLAMLASVSIRIEGGNVDIQGCTFSRVSARRGRRLSAAARQSPWVVSSQAVRHGKPESQRSLTARALAQT